MPLLNFRSPPISGRLWQPCSSPTAQTFPIRMPGSNKSASRPQTWTVKQRRPEVNLSSGDSRAETSTTVPLPSLAATQSLDSKQIAGRLTFHLASISDFITQNQVEGVLTADGDLRFDHLEADGTARANGSQLKYRGIILHSLGLDAAFKGRRSAHSEIFDIGFDPDNSVDVAGSAKLDGPVPFRSERRSELQECGHAERIP